MKSHNRCVSSEPVTYFVVQNRLVHIFFAVVFSQLDPISAIQNKKKAAETLSESAENDENMSINKD